MQNRCEVTRTQSKQHYFGNCLEYLPLQLLCNLNTLLFYYNSGQHAITCRCSTSTAGTSLHSIWISTQCDGLVSLSGTEIWKKDKLKHWTICRTNLMLCDLKHILALKKIIKGSMNENPTTRKNLISLKKILFLTHITPGCFSLNGAINDSICSNQNPLLVASQKQRHWPTSDQQGQSLTGRNLGQDDERQGETVLQRS